MIEQKKAWNQFVLENNGSFLHAYEWGEFQEAIGHKIWRIEEPGLRGLVIRHKLPYFKHYLYCPRGPIIDKRETAGGRQELFGLFLDKTRQVAEKEGSIFLKIEPGTGQEPKRRFKKSSKEIQPSKTVVLNLAESEEDLLKAMHQKTRYNIRLAQKKGVRIHETYNIKQAAEFYKLLQKTVQRDKFYAHPKKHYEKLLEILGGQGLIRLFLAEYKDKIIAANIVVFWNDTVLYLHGASDYQYRQVMAPCLLQWWTILKAKSQGFRYYDFWGIDEKKWPGVSRFKKSFGGREVTYPGAFDLIYSPFWYYAYNLVRQIL